MLKSLLPTFFLFFLFPLIKLNAQKEANNWYFGEFAGITFNTNPPTALVGAMDTIEGCSSISDKEGNLLFYSHGISIWNKNHQIMLNGSGLLGNFSSSQSGLAVPHPGVANLYYVFTLDQSGATTPYGLRYSVVDMTLDSGLGAVTSEKNILLHTPTSEKITAVKHANGKDIWVITHKYNTDEYYIYLIDSNGINTSPKILKIGITINSIGYMKVSPDGKKLAIVDYSRKNGFQIFDFDSANGTLSNTITIDPYQFKDYGTYGLEFSTNSKLLYMTSSNGIIQYDVSVMNQTAITNSRKVISNSSGNAMQLGPDGKIYIATSKKYLSVINKPNLIGLAADFVVQGVVLNNNTKSEFGLPQFIQSFFLIEDFKFDNLCFGDQTQFTLYEQEADSYVWDFGDPASGTNNSSTEMSPTHVFSAPGTYQVTLTATKGTETSTSTQEVVIVDCTDTDLDGVPDYIDLDDDNDGILDTDECTEVGSCQDLNKDGTINSLDLDSDGDGCNDVVESGGVDANNDGELDGTGVDENGMVVGGDGGYNGLSGMEYKAVRTYFTVPVNDQNVEEGSSALFTIDVKSDIATDYDPEFGPLYNSPGNGNQLVFRWFIGDPREGGILIDASNINYEGQTTNRLTVKNTTGLGGTEYFVEVLNGEDVCGYVLDSGVLTVYVLPDNDLDGVPDHIDMDDDNDGILDVEECKSNAVVDFVNWNFIASASTSTTQDNTIILTPNKRSNKGAAWYKNKLDLTRSFTMEFEVNLGNYEFGGDGMALVLQPISDLEIGYEAGGLGYQFIETGIALEFDSSSNFSSDAQYNDLSPQDHISLNNTKNMSIINNIYVDSFGELDNGENHKAVLIWDSVKRKLRFIFNDKEVFDTEIDIVGDYFGGNNMSYIGFTAGTGGLSNEHKSIINYLDNNLVCSSDTNKDGTIDSFDLDSDGDGCKDVVESRGVDANGDGTLDGTGVDEKGMVVGGVGGYNGITGAEYNASTTRIENSVQDQTVREGSPAIFTLGVVSNSATDYNNGTPIYGSENNGASQLIYQWYIGDPRNGGVLIDETNDNYTGQTTNVLTVKNTNDLDGTKYYVKVTNTNNSCEALYDDGVLNTITSIDTDNDGLTDDIDLDDDNDGILDTVECDLNKINETSFSAENGETVEFELNSQGVGFFLDITNLDNSFNITINGTPLTTKEIEFQVPQNIRFKDGSRYGSPIASIWELGPSNPETPILRFIIDENLNVKMYGSKVKNGSLYELELFNDTQLNDFTWNKNGINNFVVRQNVKGTTYIEGKVYGVSSLEENCDLDNDGIINSLDPDSDEDGCFDAIEGAENVTPSDLDSNGRIDISTKGGIDSEGVPVLVNAGGSADAGNNTQGQASGKHLTATELKVNFAALKDQTIEEGNATTFTITSATATNTTKYNGSTPDYNKGTDAGAGIRYQWYMGDPNNGGEALLDGDTYLGVNTATLTVNDVTGLNGTEYFLEVTHTENECEREVDKVKLTVDKGREEEFNIYPIPVMQEFTIVGNFEIERIEIYDAKSKLYLKRYGKERTVNINLFPTAVYHLKVFTTDGRVYDKKFTKG